MLRIALTALTASLAAACSPPPAAERSEALIAVAANFAPTAEILADAYRDESGHHVTLSSGSTGQLFARIVEGAPYDAFLSADSERPAQLVAQGRATADSQFTYAFGRLVLWSADPDRIGADGVPALAGEFRALALPNPRFAPYGAAAMETLQSLGLADALADRIVTGGDVGSTHALIASGNAELGFIAQSQWSENRGSAWVVPQDLHIPLAQDAVLLPRGADNPAAIGFLLFLQSDEARAVIAAAGYDTEGRE
ncbi:MAG: molybdate ABC transporter substrate-binding protein [Maricaulis sp.]|jgi:molybdate transport system substrate-binding protein|nr:molybdate ABC transporter substrate-binding protein [Maricaulis sp.]HAQ34060.1 molybdate ABC transporter substrate-binding protein [Alphaproteobacteria bacterium]